MERQRSPGFTLVELVMVLVLIGVLSTLGVGLLASRSAFSPFLANQQLASATLLAQQAALAGNPASALAIEQTPDIFRFTVGPATTNPRVFELSRAGTSLSVAGGLPLTLTFNANGVPTSGANLSLTFSGESTFQTCLSSRGAVYAGACQ
ncbi:prepilin-type N-terminal cleavage/methylation domain-containing protein [Marinobacter sediminum]|uniref:prepilin-type N-terminal cleavage/methylation domain-containing protein n=1 Tax=Marinobacter sediminum TaxID=256323 RepID=UPI0019393588|nr:prepilin-type N-terminal cleavage/methylation domain-containing protein [Marinobacter sediminum]